MRVSVTAVAGIMLLMLLSVQGCGRKGSLTLPPVRPDALQSAPQPVSTSVLPNNHE